MKKPRLIPVLALMAVGIGAAGVAHAAPLSSNTFVKKASTGGQFEISASQIALERSQSENVRDFAQQMVNDHSMASDKLGELVKTSKPNLANGLVDEDGKMDAKHQAELNKLREAPDADFDKEYIAAQKKAHSEAVALFTSYSNGGKDADLKSFASDTLPTLQEHKDHVIHLTP